MNLSQLRATYETLWSTCVITPSRVAEVTQVALKLVEQRAKLTYLNAENLTKVPWWAIALIHEREASQAWWANIANGDPWNRPTTHVPRGRGPFKSWLDAAVDALTKTPIYTLRSVNSWKDWSAAGALILLEMYNGFGYEVYHHEWSPYIWAATNHEQRGKYESDGHYNASVWDMQLGCAAMLKRMLELDPTIALSGQSAPPPLPVAA